MRSSFLLSVLLLVFSTAVCRAETNETAIASPPILYSQIREPRLAAPQVSLEQRAIAFVTEDMTQSQGTAAEFMNYARQKLDERVEYYGKLTSRAEVLKDKEKHIANWPNRSYRLLRDTTRTSCDENKSSCQISGLIEFGLSNSATGRLWTGTASFEYGIRFGPDGPKVFYEKGKILSVQK
jgi:hypothetical protein